MLVKSALGAAVFAMLFLSGTANLANYVGGWVNSWYSWPFSHVEKLNPSQDYLGCFRDDKSLNPFIPRALPNKEERFDGTRLDCMRKCANQFQAYAGLQNGHLCFCGSDWESVRKFGQLDDNECNMPCDYGKPSEAKPLKKGHYYESCGGKWINAVYSVRGLLLQRDRIAAKPNKLANKLFKKK